MNNQGLVARSARLALSCTALLTAALTVFNASAQTQPAECCLTLPSNAVDVQVGKYISGWTYSYLKVRIDGPTTPPVPFVGPHGGEYAGWCIEEALGFGYPSTEFPDGTYKPFPSSELYSTCDPDLNSKLPAGHQPTVYVSSAVWTQVNHILNNNPGTDWFSVQYAIWSLVGGPPTEFPPYLVADQTLVTTLLGNAAAAQAAGWKPKCGDKVAAVLVIDDTISRQMLIIEVPCVCPPACLGDYVWEDLNWNGIQDDNEPGVPGVKVDLLDCSDSLLATKNTDADGKYSFCDLAPGAYKVKFYLPDGYSFTKSLQGGDDCKDSEGEISACVTLNPGDNYICLDTGLIRPAAIGNYVWIDTNGNGLQDEANTGVANVKVDLYRCDDSLVNTMNTDANGGYLFSNLPPGDYYVVVNKPAGYEFTMQDAGDDALDSDADMTTGKMACTTLVSGETDLTWDAGLLEAVAGPCVPTTINFFGDCYTRGDNGIIREFTSGGVAVRVSAFSRVKGANGAWEPAYLGVYAGGLGVTDSSESGWYGNSHTVDNIDRLNYVLFEFSEPVILKRAKLGYVVSDSDLTLWAGSFADPFNNHLTLSDAVLGSFGFSEENVTTSSDPRWADLNAGEVVANAVVIAALTTDDSPEDQFKIAALDICGPADQFAALGNYVWEDVNQNGQQDEPASSGINGVVVKLTKCDDASFLRTTVTSDDSSGNPGYYLFTGLEPDCYQVEFVKPAGYAFTGANTGADDKDSDADAATGKTVQINLAAGSVDLTWDAGLFRDCASSICGTVWRDCDPCGSGGGDAGLAGWTVKLLGPGGSVQTTQTEAGGSFCFNGLGAGTFKVSVVPQPDYLQVGDRDGCKDNATEICLAPCQNVTGVKFAYTGTKPGITLAKTADKSSAACGETIVFTYVVTDTGNTCFYGGMSVYDPLFGQVFQQTPVKPGESFTITKTYVVKSGDVNPLNTTATAVGHVPDGLGLKDVVATATAPVLITPCTSTEVPPPGCLAASPDCGSVKLCWNPVSGAAYKIKYSLTKGGPYTTLKSGYTYNSFTHGGLANGDVYYYVVTAVKNGVESPVSNEESAIPTAGIPWFWSTKDIGAVGDQGGASYDRYSDSFKVVGSGNDIWNGSDEFRFAYIAAYGNCSVVARVTTVQNTDPWAKAGVMIRESLTPNSAHASVFVTPANGVAFQYRGATGGASGNVNTTGLAAPYWVKIVRSGSTFTAYRSANGWSWTTIGSQSIPMGSVAYIGLAVTSHKDGVLCEASIDNVSATP